ncbi:hypothetical protein P3TCK_09053 [Photobacterium profundum 3TCK]|uniref:Uncharacterized protein n=1 Tax=Photobacterium profundum 3TCK TaxID=314280 RepID=Q1YYB4_9GAMM|nr:hypothetical protein P3TCK_09053 [Photobacterium profundum 3TCK]
MTEPTIIKNGIANNGKDSADEIKRCITKLTGMESFMNKKYTIADDISEKAMGTFNKNNTNKIIIGI